MSPRNREILKRAKEAAQGTGIPLVVLLGMIKQESPRQNGKLTNTGDGLMQVTPESGHRGGQYGNTSQGIKNNIADGVATLKGFLGASGGNLAKAVSRYNGGPAENAGDPKYTQNVAKRITSGEVAENFGDEFRYDKLSDADKKAVQDLQNYQRP
jgi:soluble lytic murein transglycosylase-like protein